MAKTLLSEQAAPPREEAAAKKSARLDLFKFVPFRLNRLAAEVSNALSTEYQARYGLDIPGWRVLATLGFRKDPCSAQYVAECTRTHKSTISRWLAKARGAVLEEVRTKLGKKLGLREAELDSLIGALRSQLHVSLHRALE